MKNDRKDIYTEILDHLHTGTIIPDDLIYMLFQKTFEYTACPYLPPEISIYAKEFCVGISHLWSSQSYVSKDYDPVFIFQLGELNGCARMLDRYFSDLATQKYIDEDSNKYLSELDLFNAIFETPGIKRSELAARLNMSKFAIDQFVAKIKDRNYIMERISVDERYYYLTDTGIRLLNIMKDTGEHIREEPTQKQIIYALRIAEACDIALPEDFTKQAYWKFIKDNEPQYKAKASQYPVHSDYMEDDYMLAPDEGFYC